MLLEKYQLAAVFESILVWNIELQSDLLLFYSPCTMAVEIESQWYSCNSYDSSHPWDRSILNSSLAAKYLPISCMIFHQQCSFSHNNFHPLNRSDWYSLAPLPDLYQKSTLIGGTQPLFPDFVKFSNFPKLFRSFSLESKVTPSGRIWVRGCACRPIYQLKV